MSSKKGRGRFVEFVFKGGEKEAKSAEYAPGQDHGAQLWHEVFIVCSHTGNMELLLKYGNEERKWLKPLLRSATGEWPGMTEPEVAVATPNIATHLEGEGSSSMEKWWTSGAGTQFSCHFMGLSLPEATPWGATQLSEGDGGDEN